jgi:hypothetical protein
VSASESALPASSRAKHSCLMMGHSRIECPVGRVAPRALSREESEAAVRLFPRGARMTHFPSSRRLRLPFLRQVTDTGVGDAHGPPLVRCGAVVLGPTVVTLNGWHSGPFPVVGVRVPSRPMIHHDGPQGPPARTGRRGLPKMRLYPECPPRFLRISRALRRFPDDRFLRQRAAETAVSSPVHCVTSAG